MQFRSTRSSKLQVSFKEAVLRCLPEDGGLYVPAQVVDMRQFFLYMGEETGYPELAGMVAPALLQGELNPFSANRVAESAFDFEPELRVLDEDLSVLNLYNGPTGVFKDFGVAFLSAVLEELLKNSGPAMILSASKGDMGVSLAHAFRQRQGISSVILYPEGPIRGLESADFVTNGGNIIPIQIKGNFDECQRLIVEAIRDRPFAERYGLTSANAINPGRLLPQSFYYLYAFVKIKKHLKGDLVFSVPSGNFGNLISGLYAWKFGMPVNGFIAAMNANDPFGEFIRGGRFAPRLPVATNSPSLDVGMPSNYERLTSFYEEAPAVMRNMVYPASIDDETTLKTMGEAWKRYGILLDSHSAVAFAAADRLRASGEFSGNVHTVVLATGHPAKQAGLVAKATGQETVTLPRFVRLQKAVEPVALIEPQLEALESAIASCF
jgi:threonine synthase